MQNNKPFEQSNNNKEIGEITDELTKSKCRITNDYMMIIGKYFESNKDYVNVMKVNKKYEQLVLMYHFNPISDISLFQNIQTQHFYDELSVYNNKKRNVPIYLLVSSEL